MGEETLVLETVISEQLMVSQSSPVGPFIMPLGAVFWILTTLSRIKDYPEVALNAKALLVNLREASPSRP